jgi:hypothetical protein
VSEAAGGGGGAAAGVEAAGASSFARLFVRAPASVGHADRGHQSEEDAELAAEVQTDAAVGRRHVDQAEQDEQDREPARGEHEQRAGHVVRQRPGGLRHGHADRDDGHEEQQDVDEAERLPRARTAAAREAGDVDLEAVPRQEQRDQQDSSAHRGDLVADREPGCIHSGPPWGLRSDSARP